MRPACGCEMNELIEQEFLHPAQVAALAPVFCIGKPGKGSIGLAVTAPPTGHAGLRTARQIKAQPEGRCTSASR